MSLHLNFGLPLFLSPHFLPISSGSFPGFVPCYVWPYFPSLRYSIAKTNKAWAASHMPPAAASNLFLLIDSSTFWDTIQSSFHSRWHQLTVGHFFSILTHCSETTCLTFPSAHLRPHSVLLLTSLPSSWGHLEGWQPDNGIQSSPDLVLPSASLHLQPVITNSTTIPHLRQALQSTPTSGSLLAMSNNHTPTHQVEHTNTPTSGRHGATRSAEAG